MKRPDSPIPPHAVDWLLAALVVVLAPHAVDLPPWLTALWLATAGLAWGAARDRWRPPGTAVRLLLVVAVVGGVLLQYHTIAGRDAGVGLLVGMVALKLLELKGRRDAMILLFLGYFLVAARFLFSQSIPTALYLFAAVIAVTAAMMAVTHPESGEGARGRLRLAGTLLLQALPIAVVLFLLFPRLPGPLWQMPKDASSGLTGLSDSMSPGDIGRLSQSSAVAFRVEFDGPIPDLANAYWRGPVLWSFNGRRWSAVPRPPVESARFQAIGEPVSYHVTLEPHIREWLFALDIPATVPPGARLNADFQLLADGPVLERYRYAVTSYPNYRIEVERSPRSWRALSLGAWEGENARARGLADRWRLESDEPRELVARALRHFREEPFAYTLTPPILGADPVDAFLFDSRRGFCEHYSGAFTFLMRAAGVPARVVTGYQGGEINGDYVIVRQSDAHAWAEVWLKGEGWVRVDPTAAVAPERVERGLAAALDVGEPIPFLARRDYGLLHRMALRWDRVNNLWNLWVIGYGQENQQKLLSSLLPFLAHWQGMAVGLLTGVGGLLAFAAFRLFRPGAGAPLDPAQRAWLRFCRRMARDGLPRRPDEGPLDFQRRIIKERPQRAALAGEINRLYARLRYGPTPDPTALKRLKHLVRRFGLPGT